MRIKKIRNDGRVQCGLSEDGSCLGFDGARQAFRLIAPVEPGTTCILPRLAARRKREEAQKARAENAGSYSLGTKVRAPRRIPNFTN